MKRRVMIAKALSHEPELLFLDEPTAGVDVNLRRDMWALVRKLRAKGVTIILTTHYIEEAEEIADRVGVINGGELLLVEDKAALMAKLGRKQLILELNDPLEKLPDCFAGNGLSIEAEGNRLVYEFDTHNEHESVASLLTRLGENNIHFRDLSTRQSSLEDIFVSLVGGAK
jgi:ABC-2 type transport system ATP-binding protein